MLDVEEIRKRAVERGRTDLLFFCQYFLPKYFDLEAGGFHKDLCELAVRKDGSWYIIVVPRHHGKSTFFSFALPIWLGCYNEESQFPILVISESGDLAEKWVTKIKTEFEANEIIIEHFGDLRGGVWQARDISLKNGTQIVARGAGQQARGWHWKTIICDDLEGNEGNRSEFQLDNLRDWFDRELFYTMDAKSKIYYIGTVISSNCLLMDLVKKANENVGGWKKFWTTAYKDGIEKEGNEIFPAKWNHESLQKMKQNNPFAFAQEMMNEPVPDSDKRFKPEWIQLYDEIPTGLRVFTTIDPSLSQKRRADKSAIVTCGVSPGGQIYVIDVYNEINDPYALTEAIFRINRLYAPYKLGVEVVAFQKMLKFWLTDKARERNIYLPIEELKTDTKVSKQLRICGLIPYFAEKKVFIKKGQYSLIQQLREFSPSLTNAHDDALDALAYQVQLWLKPGYTNVTPTMSGEEWLRAAQARSLQNMFNDVDDKPIPATGYRSNFRVGH